MQSFSKFFFLLQYFLIFVQRVSSSQNFKSEILKFFCYFSLSFLPLLYLMGLDGLVGSTVSSFSSDLSFEVLESRSNLVAFWLLFIEFILKFKWHSVVSVLGLLKFDSCLMNLSQNVQILMFIHRGFSSLIEENVIFLPELFDFALEHSVCINEGIVCIFGLIDGHLKFFFNFLVRTHLLF